MVFRTVNTRHPLNQLRDEMDRLWSGVAESAAAANLWSRPGRGHHALNLWEEGDTLKAELEVPGLKEDQVDISVIGGELSIELHRPEVKQEGVVYHRRERPVGDFRRVLRLPADVDPDRVTAQLRDGVLTISLPKAESAKPRKIHVGVN